MTEFSYKACNICPFLCGADRTGEKLGRCGASSKMRVSRIAPHYWEEPCISGQGLEMPVRGSGTVFFTGCSLHCVYCQNSKISRRDTEYGEIFTTDELAEKLLILQSEGVHNINLVTSSHFLPDVITTLSKAKANGLKIPVIYNCGGYESIDAISALDGLVDIYMPDMKYFSPRLSELYSHVTNYPEVSKKAISAMQAQTGKPVFDDSGFMLSGTLVRHLILPGSDLDSRNIIAYLHTVFGSDGIALSLMSQYTPMPDIKFPELTETLPHMAYLRVIEHAESESFIPNFK